MIDTPRFQRLSAQDAPAWLAAHPEALVLDAREAAHHAQAHLIGSLRLDGRNHERLLLSEPRQRPVFIYCYHGNASRTYAQMFVDFGFREVFDLIGGWEAWQKQAATQATGAVAPAADTAAPAASSAIDTLPPGLAAWLRQQGLADAHTPGHHGNTPLMHAAWRGEAAVVETLLAQGVSLTAVNGDGNNALWLACVANDPVLVTRLARAGVPVDHANLTGATSLMYAASSSKPAVLRTLLALGADPHLATQDDYTALDMAGCLESLQLLRAATRATLARQAQGATA
jgi:rhodanese-related sulfurtransferase